MDFEYPWGATKTAESHRLTPRVWESPGRTRGGDGESPKRHMRRLPVAWLLPLSAQSSLRTLYQLCSGSAQARVPGVILLSPDRKQATLRKGSGKSEVYAIERNKPNSPSKVWTRQRHLFSPFLFNTTGEILANTIGKKKKGGIPIEKEKIKTVPILRQHDYLHGKSQEIYKDSNNKFQKLLNVLSKVVRCKATPQKSIMFLYSISTQMNTKNA